MKVNHIGMRFFEDAEEAPRRPANADPRSPVRRNHLLASVRRAGRGTLCEYAGVVALLSLQAAHLRDECLGPAISMLSTTCAILIQVVLNLRQQGADHSLFLAWIAASCSTSESVHQVHGPKQDVHHEYQRNYQYSGIRQHAREPQADDHPSPQSHLEATSAMPPTGKTS